ncbi:DciA family protein [Candidatus Rickettsia kedanie]|uniref:DciA family protein n=1 Tax=Candidatus Rickettsia kedanie TaxID=3115352 RepID=A0ABP9TRT6_9RICK
MKLIKEDIDKIVRRIFSKQHPLLPAIIINWNKIVGFNFSNKALPLKITTYTYKKQKINTLFIQAEDNTIAAELPYYQDIILERIKIYLGFAAIHKMNVTFYKEKSKIG